MAWTIKQHDTAPPYVAALRNDFGETSESALDLTDATSVYFLMRPSGVGDVTPTIRALCTIDDAVNGLVTYQWVTGDTDITDTYDVEFEIDWSDGTIQTVPNDGYMTVVVEDDLDV